MLNWKKIPFIRLLLPFIVGILTAIITKFELPYSYPILIFLILLLILDHQKTQKFRRWWTTGTLLFFVLFVLGFQRVYHHNELSSDRHFKQHLQQENTIRAIVSEMPTIKNSIKLNLQVQSILVDDITQSVGGNLLAYAALDSLSQSLNYGDEILLRNIHINAIKPPNNPQQFDYQSYLYFQNIHYQTYLGTESIEKINSNQGNVILSTAYETRKWCIQTLEKYLHADALAVGTALILGYKVLLNDNLKEAYSQTGAMHVLAVSGLHVGLIAFILNFLIGLFPTRTLSSKIIGFLVQVLGLFAFALLTGASPSVLRAATMFGLLIGGKTFARSASTYNILAASAFILLLINPYYIMQVGFQLSYLAVIGIVYLQPVIKNWIFLNFKPLDYLWSLAAVSIAAQIGTLPVSLYYFHQFPIYFILSGFIVVPTAGFILAGGLVLFFFELIFPPIAALVGLLLNGLITLVNAAIFGLQKFPIGTIEGIWLSFVGVIMLYICILLLIKAFISRKMKWLNYGLLVFLVLIVSWQINAYQKKQQTSLVIYDNPKNSLIDLFQSQHLISLKNRLLETDKIQFVATNNRTFRGIQSTETKVLDKESASNSKLTFADKSFVILQEITDTIPKNTNYLLVQNTPNLNLSALLKKYPPQLVIFDSSNDTWKVNKWVEECKALNVAYHVTRTAGAYVEEF